MLKIHFGSLPDEIYNTEVYYANQYDKEWVMDDFARKVIADIDDSEVIAPDLIQNEIFGTFPSTELSAGVKTLLLMHNELKKIFNICNCGDNCAKYILEIAQERDIKVCVVLRGRNWYRDLEETHESIVFVEESTHFLVEQTKDRPRTDPGYAILKIKLYCL